jgi:GMP synthase (glutamine-hydrolysing)
MRVLITTHVESEGPGTLGTFLESQGAELRIARLHEGEGLPSDIAEIDAVVSMGGPMNVYEDDRYPFLRDEALLIRNAIQADLPVLGICLGAQMIARCSGAIVTKSPKKEVGWCKVSLTEEGEKSPAFSGLASELEVLQWHEDMFKIPEGGKLLAASKDCPHQAFTYRKALGLQFHLEVTRGMLAEWFADDPIVESVLSRYDELEADLNRNAETIYRNWVASFG